MKRYKRFFGWFEWLLKWYVRLFTGLLKTVFIICVLDWAWIFPMDALRTNIALESYNSSLSAPRAIMGREFAKDIKNGGTVVLVKYADDPERVYLYRYFKGELTFEQERVGDLMRPPEIIS